MTSNDLLDLLRYRILDRRNGHEEARDRLMLEAADEIERLRYELGSFSTWATNPRTVALMARCEAAERRTADETPACGCYTITNHLGDSRTNYCAKHAPNAAEVQP